MIDDREESKLRRRERRRMDELCAARDHSLVARLYIEGGMPYGAGCAARHAARHGAKYLQFTSAS